MMTTEFFEERLIDLYRQVSPHKEPIIQAMLSGEIAYCEGERGANFPRDLKQLNRPVIALLGDDDLFSSGPMGFPGARKFVNWARFVIVHGCGAERWHYDAAVKAAHVHGRVLFIETDSAHAEEWLQFVASSNRKVFCFLVPPGGGQHPIAPIVH